MKNTNSLATTLLANSMEFYAGMENLLAETKRTKSNYGMWQLTLEGITVDLCRSENRKAWELWSLEGDKISIENATINEAKAAFVFHVRCEMQTAERVAKLELQWAEEDAKAKEN